jgi:hypothetical protein
MTASGYRYIIVLEVSVQIGSVSAHDSLIAAALRSCVIVRTEYRSRCRNKFSKSAVILPTRDTAGIHNIDDRWHIVGRRDTVNDANSVLNVDQIQPLIGRSGQWFFRLQVRNSSE